MNGIGHTIDFPNRNQILTTAFIWVDSVNCANMTTSINSIVTNEKIVAYPNPTASVLKMKFSKAITPTSTIEIFEVFRFKNRFDLSEKSITLMYKTWK